MTMNRLKRKMNEQMTKKVKVEIAMVVMMMKMIWMTRTDEHHAPSITMI